jgi:hypothetical protein
MVTPGGAQQSYNINSLVCPTPTIATIENIAEYRGLSNPIPTPANENTGTLAGVSGADLHSTIFLTKEYRNRAKAATALCDAIAECHPEDACILMEAALLDLGAGSPIPPLFSVMDAAIDWAEWASTAELKAYALACYNCLRPADRSAFLAYVARVA